MSLFCTPYHFSWQGDPFSADMYAFGVVAWEIATRKFPFKVVVEVVVMVEVVVARGQQALKISGHRPAFNTTHNSRCPCACLSTCMCACAVAGSGQESDNRGSRLRKRTAGCAGRQLYSSSADADCDVLERKPPGAPEAA